MQKRPVAVEIGSASWQDWHGIQSFSFKFAKICQIIVRPRTMKPFSEPELEIAERLIHVIKDGLHSPGEIPELSFAKRISDFVIELWSKRIHPKTMEYAPKSLALRMNEALEPVLEFPVPCMFHPSGAFRSSD